MTAKIDLKKDGEGVKKVKFNQNFDTNSYINLLTNKVLPSIKLKFNNDLSNVTYIWDNSSVHTGDNEDGLSEKELLNKNNLDLEKNWPPYSLDLNPVENVWALVNKEKCKIEEKDYPKNKFEDFSLIKKAYENVSNVTVLNCYNSFKNKLKLLLLKDGNNNFDY